MRARKPEPKGADLGRDDAGDHVRLEVEDAVAVVVIDNPPVNATSVEVRRGILNAASEIAGRDDLVGAVLIGAGKTFVAGADIKEFDRTPKDPQLPAIVAAIAACPTPVVAAIHGFALGGGLELALGCDARIATPDAKVGFPEVELGVIPGAGGTQRLPRLVGVARAIEIITSGRKIPAAEARQLGILDEVAEGNLRQAAIRHARQLGGRKRRVAELRAPPADEPAVAEAAAAALRGRKGRTAVAAAIEIIKSAAELPFAEGLAHERETFQRLRAGFEAKALRYLFFAERRAGRAPEGAAARDIAIVGIIGAGLMGCGIAAAFALAGIRVLITDKDEAAARASTGRVEALLSDAAGRNLTSPENASAAAARVEAFSDLSRLGEADLVVEAVVEDLAVKREVFAALEPLLKPDAILVSNTSYLDIDALAAATSRPAQFAGLHFFSPAQIMRLVEVVRGDETSPEVIATLLRVVRRMGKLPVLARVGEGFIGNRIFNAYRRQCEFMVEEGATPKEVDDALVAFGMKMGPFAVSDMAGLDIAWRMRQRLAKKRDPKVRYPELADKLCEMGRFGRKTGAGWYRYGAESRRGEPDPVVDELIQTHSDRKDIERRALSEAEIQARALAAMINEAALLLAEGIAEQPSDIDLVLVNGYGFPAEKGGPLFWAASQPISEVLSGIDGMLDASGFGFERGNVEKVLDQLPG